MIKICAWCKKVMGETPPLEDKSETHGICPECRDKNMPKRREPMKLEEAIKVMEVEEASDFAGITYDYEEAARLGIEAMKTIVKDRKGTFAILLPGETK